jgi:glutamine---fructose-6-phosphate transaminase (isomerizing)
MGAGPEFGVAATKTFVATVSALLRLTAAWTGDESLDAGVSRLPMRLASAVRLDWSQAVETLAGAGSMATIGRGPTLAAAREAALKLKETCNLNAEAFSGAEFLHGPVTLASPRHPVLMFMPGDAAAEGMRQLCNKLRRLNTAVLIAGWRDPMTEGCLPALPADQPEADAVCLILSFYAFTLRLAQHLGIDPDQPRNLQKVTRTR